MPCISAVHIPEAIDTYISEKNWDEAFYVAELFSLDPRPILEAVITHCIYNMKSQSNRYDGLTSNTYWRTKSADTHMETIAETELGNH
jgi:hypothetical protein